MSNVGWLAVGFGVVWLLIGLYLVRLWRAERAIEGRLDELAARHDNATGPASPGPDRHVG